MRVISGDQTGQLKEYSVENGQAVRVYTEQDRSREPLHLSWLDSQESAVRHVLRRWLYGRSLTFVSFKNLLR